MSRNSDDESRSDRRRKRSKSRSRPFSSQFIADALTDASEFLAQAVAQVEDARRIASSRPGSTRAASRPPPAQTRTSPLPCPLTSGTPGPQCPMVSQWPSACSAIFGPQADGSILPERDGLSEAPPFGNLGPPSLHGGLGRFLPGQSNFLNSSGSLFTQPSFSQYSESSISSENAFRSSRLLPSSASLFIQPSIQDSNQPLSQFFGVSSSPSSLLSNRFGSNESRVHFSADDEDIRPSRTSYIRDTLARLSVFPSLIEEPPLQCSEGASVCPYTVPLNTSVDENVAMHAHSHVKTRTIICPFTSPKSKKKSSKPKKPPAPKVPLPVTLGENLLKATQDGKVEEMRKLMENGADPNYFKAPVGAALHVAVDTANDEALSLLLEKGASICVRTPEGLTALHIAAQKDTNGKCISKLIDAGCDIRGRDTRGRTPLHYASESGNTKAIRMLKAAGVCKMSKDSEGKTPLDLAKNESVKKTVNL